MEIDKKKVAAGLKTAANIGSNVVKAGASIAREAAPVVGSVINGGLDILSSLLSKGGTGSSGGGADYNKPYTPSENVTQLGGQLNSLKAPVQKPSTYQESLQQTMDAILNKEDFKYDVNADALFQQYKDQYVLGGQMAMQDTMGQAASLTGGYGNSFAQTAGQQQYQAHLQQLTDKIPELYQLARESHDRDLSNLYNRYGLLSDAEAKEYSRFRDEKADFYNDRDFLANQYFNERDFDYGKWADNRDFTYRQHRDDVADQQWQDTFDRGVYESDRAYNRGVYESDRNYNRATYESDRDYQYKLDRDAIEDERYDAQWQNTLDRQKVADSQWNMEFDLASKKANNTGGGSGGSGGGGGNNSGNNTGGNPTGGNPVEDATEKALAGLKSYEDAVKFLKDNGKSTAGIMTRNEWLRRKASYETTGTGSVEVTENSSYAEYLKDYCKYLVSPNT